MAGSQKDADGCAGARGAGRLVNNGDIVYTVAVEVPL